jgi:hypothetical protein
MCGWRRPFSWTTFGWRVSVERGNLSAEQGHAIDVTYFRSFQIL